MARAPAVGGRRRPAGGQPGRPAHAAAARVPYWPLAVVGLASSRTTCCSSSRATAWPTPLRSQKRAAHAPDRARLGGACRHGLLHRRHPEPPHHRVRLPPDHCRHPAVAACLLPAGHGGRGVECRPSPCTADGRRPAARPASRARWWSPPALEVWAALSCLFVVTVFLATSISARLREKEAELFASERSVERSYRSMESLYALGQLVNSTLDLDEVLRLIARHATTLLHGKAASIRLLDSTGKNAVDGGGLRAQRRVPEQGPRGRREQRRRRGRAGGPRHPGARRDERPAVPVPGRRPARGAAVDALMPDDARRTGRWASSASTRPK